MPLRAAYRRSISDSLKHDKQFRDFAYAALELVEQNPYIAVAFEDGTHREVSFWDLYCQVYREDSIALEDKIMTGLAWQKVLQNGYIYRVFQVREEPRPDKDIEGNNSILQDMVYCYGSIFRRAEFWGGTQGADGYIEFKDVAIRHFRGIHRRPGDHRIDFLDVPQSVSGKSKWFPLEVGYCHPDQIETHFLDARCAARFSYGHDLIFFFEDVTERVDHLALLLGLRVEEDISNQLHISCEESTGQLALW
jgi:hypothetical protein